MSSTLLEKYSKRIQVAENLYSKAHNGAKLDSIRKTTLARCLENTSNFLAEAFDGSQGTQRAALGDYKKFCLNLVNCAVPNLNVA